MFSRCRRALISFVAEKLPRRLILVGIPRALVGVSSSLRQLLAARGKTYWWLVLIRAGDIY